MFLSVDDQQQKSPGKVLFVIDIVALAGVFIIAICLFLWYTVNTAKT